MASLKKIISSAVALVLLIGNAMLPTYAFDGADIEPYRSSYYLDSYRAWLEPKDDGYIDVIVDVQATGYMDEIGTTNIVIFESVDDGENWEIVRAYASLLTPGMIENDKFIYYETPVSYEGIPGRMYIAIVTVYAGDSEGGDSRDYTTTPVYARY